jgi:aryl-alcohol dehydrogenase-like predicted oxidoreductase
MGAELVNRSSMPIEPLPGLSRYVYGTTRLGDDKIPVEDRIGVVREAVDAGLWIHTSHQYGEALKVIRAALDLDRSKIPGVICKIGWESVSQIREQMMLHIEALGLERMDVGQLCLGGPLAESLRNGGPEIEALNRLKDEGLVGRYVLEVFPWTSEAPLAAIRDERAAALIDAVIFYLNPLQRFVSDDLWDELMVKRFPIVAMRTVAGGSIRKLTEPGGGGPEYLRNRAGEIAPIFERSGCGSWTEFCVRFSLGYSQVLATVGSTSHRDRLSEFVSCAASAAPLPQALTAEIEQLQRKWWAEVDRHAEPWTM